MIKKKVILLLWVLLGFGAVVLFFVGAKNKGEKLCKGINIEVVERAKQVYVDVQGIKIEIGERGGKVGMPLNQIDLRSIEAQLKKDAWIKDVKLYFDNSQILQAEIKESDPVARVFTLSGNSFYIDSSAKYLPTSINVVARIPVFTGFPSDKRQLSSPDSALLGQVKAIANFIICDTFWSAFVSQVNILPNATFQIIPTLGSQIISIGNADHLQGKFDRLFSFYKQVLSRTGIEKYNKIDVQYNGQVVASNNSTTPQLAGTNITAINSNDSIASAKIKETAKPAATGINSATAKLPSIIHTKKIIKPTTNSKTTKNKNK